MVRVAMQLRLPRPEGRASGKKAPRVSKEDNTPEGIAELLAANQYYRTTPWPSPFHSTKHRLVEGDARDLSWLPGSSVHLVVTSPPYWTLKAYEPNSAQLGEVAD